VFDQPYLKYEYLDAKGDAPQLMSKEACWKNDMQDNPADAFETRSPSSSGGTPLEVPATMG
jgi:hypothetical protein